MRWLSITAALASAAMLTLSACSSDDTDEGADEHADEHSHTEDTETEESSDTEESTESTDTTETTESEESTDTTETESESESESEETTETETGGGPFTLSSPAYDDGGVIPDDNTCFGANVSPQLDWENAPAETQSFAVFFTDLTFSFDHSAIWNIDAGATGLPADVDKMPMPADVPGAIQAESYAGWHGYAGPCPPAEHTYQFILYALDVDTLDGEINENSGLGQVKAAFEAHALEQVTLDGMFDPP
ncbi:hypothetical protein PPSIR1_34857 [Plesiocystis pacifica SIR-1]|uniref:YbhB/YbcL family Raf kinase inhibitor-like protein n=1 Tax=Plesiocystis pacifica SIR-1 TaxID=391625 RepID=A6GEB2_9BACT|nr:YbhB/YbcL family Raf kinase inhibitor-like protein [Plesiocystis pacifica]EDM75830.1 hypothetical protein PPSIR1_34857 [Plesiocystis pacifica SIR-1]